MTSGGGVVETIRQQLAAGYSSDQVVEGLVAGGLSRPSAERFVQRAGGQATATAPPALPVNAVAPPPLPSALTAATGDDGPPPLPPALPPPLPPSLHASAAAPMVNEPYDPQAYGAPIYDDEAGAPRPQAETIYDGPPPLPWASER